MPAMFRSLPVRSVLMFDKHLKQSNVTYRQHIKWALTAGIRLIWAGVASVIHGVNPRWFDGVAPKIIIEIYHSHLEHHANPDYQKMIKDAKASRSDSV